MTRRVLFPARPRVMEVQALAGRAARVGDAGVAGAQRDEPDLPVIELGEDGLVGELGVEDQQRRVAPGHLAPVVGERDDLPVLGLGLGQVGVGIQQGVGGGVLGEEGEHRAGALGPAGHVVLFRHRVLAPVHDGVEVQVERLALGEPGRDGGLVQRGQEGGLPGVLAAGRSR